MKHCYDVKCYELAVYFFGEKDPRLQDIAQEIQDAVESFPTDLDYIASDCRHGAVVQTGCPSCEKKLGRVDVEIDDGYHD